MLARFRPMTHRSKSSHRPPRARLDSFLLGWVRKGVFRGVVLPLLLGSCAVVAESPAQKAAATASKADANTLVAEFVAQHRQSLEKLATLYARRLEAEKPGTPEAAAAVQATLEDLKKNGPEGGPVTPQPGLPPAAAALLAEHAQKASLITSSLGRQYLLRLESLRAQCERAGDTAGAAEAARARENVAALCKTPDLTFVRKAPGHEAEVTVEAWSTGGVELHITPTELRWVTLGDATKPGLAEGKDHPAYVDGRAWVPRWSIPQPRGADRSEPWPLSMELSGLEVKLLALTTKRGAPTQGPLPELKTRLENGNLVVQLPVLKEGARWFKLLLKPTPAKAPETR